MLNEINGKRLLATLKADTCSCARQERDLQSNIHLKTCELKRQIKETRYNFQKEYKRVCETFGCRTLNSVILHLEKSQQIWSEIDMFKQDCEEGIYKFIQVCKLIKKISIWSSLVRLNDVDQLLNSDEISQANLLHSSILSFYDKIKQFQKDFPVPPIKSSTRTSYELSLDKFANARLIKAISINLSKSKDLKELTICGLNMSTSSAKKLNSGLLQAKSLKKLRINFCLNSRALVQILLPSLTNPYLLPIEELSLAANGLADAEVGELITRIIISHTEYRDTVEWKYGLRGELPPREELLGIKKLDLSFNKLGQKAARAIGLALKADRYLLSLNLRSNQIENREALEILSCLQFNKTLFNLDLRDNVQIRPKVYRKLAIKLLSNFTYLSTQTPPQIWHHDRKYFDQDLLIVKIPSSKVRTYIRKLESIKVMSLSEAMSRQTPKQIQSPKSKHRYFSLDRSLELIKEETIQNDASNNNIPTMSEPRPLSQKAVNKQKLKTINQTISDETINLNSTLSTLLTKSITSQISK